MNVVLKPYLHLLLSVGFYKPLLSSGFSTPRAENERKGFAEVVDPRSRGTSDKNCINVLRVESSRRRGRPSTRSGNIRSGISQREKAAGVGTQPDKKQ